jgi:uncharacterized protein
VSEHGERQRDPRTDQGGPLFDRLVVLADALRRAGVDVSTGELIDAASALQHLELTDRRSLQAALRAAMVKSPDGLERFDRLFEIIFRAGSLDGLSTADGGTATASDSAPTTSSSPSGLSKEILDALSSGDADQLKALAEQAVDAVGGIEPGERSATYFMHRVLRAIDLSRMLSAALQQARRDTTLTELEIALQRSELAALLEQFRRDLAAAIAGRLGEHHQPVDLAAGVADPTERDILHLSGTELAELRRIVQPLARQLAARVGRRRKARSTGRLDARRTIRRSLDTGGVPIDVVNRRNHPHRPEIVLLCDVSGSVVDFAQFTFSLVNALHHELSRVRSFAFVDGIGEVTDLFATASFDIPVARFVERKGVLGPDGHSDYGRVFGQFVDSYLDDAVNARTTVIITGDARSNYRPSNAAALQQIADRARRVYWLNPEGLEQWNTKDSVVDDYEARCKEMFEVRTLRQLADVIAELV